MKNKDYKNLMWQCWNIPTNINDLTDFQLYNIRKAIVSNKKEEYFGYKKHIWIEAITSILIQRNKDTITIINNYINSGRIKKAKLYANYIINNILKSSNETLSIKQL